MKKIVAISIWLFLLCSCSHNPDSGYNFPFLYKIDIQQGNVVNQRMLDRLKLGMVMDQVKFIMGTPILIDPFHNQRWDYIYSFQKGGGVREQRRITLHFENNKLAFISGDIQTSNSLRADTVDITEQKAISAEEEPIEPGEITPENQ